MLSPKMLQALNAQVNAELSSSYLYLAMATHCEAGAFKGFGKWLRVQSGEEHAHALKVIDHILARGGRVAFTPIAAPPAQSGSPAEIFEAVLAHERHITGRIHELHALAVAENDLPTQIFLQWYVGEQVEEEAAASELVEKLKLVGDKPSAALYLDKEYGKRGKEE